MSPLEQYKALVDDYYRLIDQPGWLDGPRDELVRRMDAIWPRLNKEQQHWIEHVHMKAIYLRRIG